ncbi:MAG: O-acetylhomoserine aminocarboxypropyltransferase/cysteine synthase [Deltaproteobacteria bacterium HGW-Deltaproteobacteria-17]|nr:MAG: O-acetylhomoserine aminocarboxypropyltransferase/cysteine synthase [Deltaproteobacteria bacterium HGW-Deltaproteobacteria-17]
MSKQKYLDAAKRAMEWHAEYRKNMRDCRFDTIAVHGLYSMQEALDYNQGSIIEPMYMSTSQSYRDSDEMELALGYQIPTWCYARIANPSMYYLEGLLALLEEYHTGQEASCLVTSSGMSAIRTAVEEFLHPDPKDPKRPRNFVATSQVYGGTYQLFSVRKDAEENCEWRKVIHSDDISEWESLIDENTRFLYGEMPSNPTLAFFDLEKVAALAHKHGIPMIVDATVASPALMRPLAHGADIVIQSVTKSLSSSGFGVAGAIIAKKNITCRLDNDALKADFCGYLKLLPARDYGPNLTPQQCVLIINDVRTLRMKMDQMSRNTLKVAQFLESHKGIEKVNYLGLPSCPLHEVASKYMFLVDAEHDELYGKPVNRYGHLMSFEVKGGAQATRDVFDAFSRIWRATDLGRIKSVATIPAISTHSQQGEEGRKLAAIPSTLIRLSVGAEHPDDVIRDLDRALGVLDGRSVVHTTPEYSAGGASSALLRNPV